MITGYSPSRISILQADPAFAELVAYYATQAEQVYLDVHQRLAALGIASMDELQERLESDPESFKNRELMSLVELTMDRTVAPAKGGKGTDGPAQGPAVQVVVQFGERPQPPASVVIDNGEGF